MAFPIPSPGLVIRYSFLWSDDAARGQEEGDKDRPCAVVVTTTNDAGDTVVYVLPITHTPPRNAAHAVEIPIATKRRLGLDDERSWIIISELNRFIWPGPDLRMRVAGDPSSVAYGELPAKLMTDVLVRLEAAVAARRARTTKRSQ